LTQWDTRSMPTVSCRPVMKASFSFVPTPSTLETSTGSSMPERSRLEHGAEAADVLQHVVVEGAADEFLDLADRLVGRVDVDAGVLVAESGFLLAHEQHSPVR
jgi:hypothetical protein